MTGEVYFRPCVRLVKLLKKFRKEDGKYSANEASCNDFLGEIFKCGVQPRIYIMYLTEEIIQL